MSGVIWKFQCYQLALLNETRLYRNDTVVTALGTEQITRILLELYCFLRLFHVPVLAQGSLVNLL